MYTQLYALNLRRIEHFISEVTAITGGAKTRLWPFLFDSIQGLHPRWQLSISGNVMRRPYTALSYYSSPQRGWQDLERGVPPEFGDPRLQWLLRQMVLESAEYVYRCRDARFNAVFCIWLEEQGVVRTADETRAYQWWRDNLFYNHAPMPEVLAFLECDSHRAFWSPETVAEAAGLERSTGLFRAVGDRLAVTDYGRLVGHELLRMAKFLELVEVEAYGLYYQEDAT